MAGIGRALYTVGVWIRETGQALDRVGCRLQGKNGYLEQFNRHRPVMGLFDKQPKIPADTFVAPSAAVIGDVTLGHKSSVWYGAVLRADVSSISVGNYSNIQDGTIVHVTRHSLNGSLLPAIIGDRVTIGHNAVIHACTLEDDSFVGIGATVMDGAVVEKGAIVAAGATVLPNTRVPTGQLWAGSPAKFLRNLTAEETDFIPKSAENYAKLGEEHLVETSKSFEEVEEEKETRQAAA